MQVNDTNNSNGSSVNASSISADQLLASRLVAAAAAANNVVGGTLPSSAQLEDIKPPAQSQQFIDMSKLIETRNVSLIF